MALTRFKNKLSHDLKEDFEYESTRKMLERNIYIKKGKKKAMKYHMKHMQRN